MKSKLIFSFLVITSLLAIAPTAMASNTWYVDGVNGNDNNDCKTSQTACQTIGHAISLASSGDTVRLAPATYLENLTITFDLGIIGSDTKTTIIDGNRTYRVLTVASSTAHVRLAKLTIQNGLCNGCDGGGILNYGALTIDHSIIRANSSYSYGGGINNMQGSLMINFTTIDRNHAYMGAGIFNYLGPATINNSTISGNDAEGIYHNNAPMVINNSSITRNTKGGIFTLGDLWINNTTINGNTPWDDSGGIYSIYDFPVILQNSIVANNYGMNCTGDAVTSNGYNLSSDDTCDFTGPGDMNNTKPKLGPLQNNGGPTQTMKLFPGSPAIDAGNPNGCTDDKGSLLKTDQRGWLRPDKQSGRCDIGAFERHRK